MCRSGALYVRKLGVGSSDYSHETTSKYQSCPCPKLRYGLSFGDLKKLLVKPLWLNRRYGASSFCTKLA